MDPGLRRVTRIPLEELWDDKGAFGQRLSYLTAHRIKEILRQAPVRLVEADVGAGLRWTAPEDCYARWKQVAANVADPDGFSLEDFPDDVAFVASEWRGRAGERLIVLELHH